MAPLTARRVDPWALARRQHAVVSHEQLVVPGFGPEAIKHRIRSGRLHPKWRGVYAIGRPELTRCGEWMAAVLACGPAAVPTHRSAAALWGIAPDDPPAPIHVTLPADLRRRHRGSSRTGPAAKSRGASASR